MTTSTSTQTVRNYVDGQWLESQATTFFEVENPSTGDVIGRTPLSTSAETTHAIDLADKA